MPEEQIYDQPRFTHTERDRRWSLVREAMERDNVDCVIAPNNTGHSTHFQAEARYLSHVGGGGDADVACVFPLEGEVAAVATSHERWRHVQDWVTDLREARRAYGAGVVGKLREVKLPRNRVGIVGLGDYIRAPEGTVLHGFMRALTEAFPNVEWVDYSQQLASIRTIKSDEEIAMLQKSTELIERAIDRVTEVARPGVMDYTVWGAAIGELVMGGSEIPVHNHWGTGLHPQTLTRPGHAPLERGYLIVNEIEAAYAGYHAQGVQPFAVQDCDPVYKDLHAMHAEYWQRCFDALKPGVTVGEIDELCKSLGAEVLPTGSSYTKAAGSLAMHGRGLGSDGPLVTGGREQTDYDAVFTPGWAFVFKPSLRLEANGRRYSGSWGDTVVITPQGAQRLGKRPVGLVIAGLD
ncbi:MAG: Xaa-Pro dipeptidase [Chloroflexota bacterium]|nr:Xaa-Pro dipeptidase [Chloroflexota bacterium]